MIIHTEKAPFLNGVKLVQKETGFIRNKQVSQLLHGRDSIGCAKHSKPRQRTYAPKEFDAISKRPAKLEHELGSFVFSEVLTKCRSAGTGSSKYPLRCEKAVQKASAICKAQSARKGVLCGAPKPNVGQQYYIFYGQRRLEIFLYYSVSLCRQNRGLQNISQRQYELGYSCILKCLSGARQTEASDIPWRSREAVHMCCFHTASSKERRQPVFFRHWSPA